MPPVIIVMAKAPIAGFAKTRLTSHLSASEAASLALCFVQDVINSALTIIPNLIVAFTPATGRVILQSKLPKDLMWLEQQGKNLGDRLNSAIAQAAHLGFSPIIVLGADSPTLPTAFIETAREALATEKADITLGPTTDGGYYLVGIRNPIPQLFKNIAWSTASVYEQTTQNVRQLGLRLLELPPWHDVDTFDDLGRLKSELLLDRQSRTLARLTYAWLHAYDRVPLPTG